jgi:myo-inositol-1(or 4)-monophosphatase
MKKSRELQTAIAAARAAEKILLKNMDKQHIARKKGAHDFCTNVDLKAEKAIMGIIAKRFPEHNIVSEEEGDIGKKSGFSWLVDPIDGTKNYFRKIPLFAVSVALAKGNDVLAGAVLDPSTRRLYYAEKGKGAFLNGKRIHVSKTSRMKDASLYIDSENPFELRGKQAKRALKRQENLQKNSYRVRNFGASTLALCYLAQGGYDAYVHLQRVKRMDVAAGALMVREAGGKITSADGSRFRLERMPVAASNGLLQRQLLKLL